MKGQAFDTFKLMIAAVIAVAILGILLGILGSISPQVGDPISLIKQNLGKAYSTPGSTYTSSGKANFEKGIIISGSSFESTLGGTGTVQFYCDSKLTPERCKIGTDKTELEILSSFEAKIYTCCNTDDKCFVAVGGRPASNWCK